MALGLDEEIMRKPSETDFERVYETYRARIYRFLVGLIGAAEAEDLSQEVFLKAHQGLSDFRGESQLSTWLYRIATHTAIDRMREASFQRGKQECSLDESSVLNGKVVWTVEREPTLEQTLLQKDRYQCFLGYLKSLPIIIALSSCSGKSKIYPPERSPGSSV